MDSGTCPDQFGLLWSTRTSCTTFSGPACFTLHLLSPVSSSLSPPSPSFPSPPPSTSSPGQSFQPPHPLSLPRVISFAKTGSRFNIADLSKTFFVCLKQQQEIVMLRAVARCLGRSHKREISPQVARSVGRGLWHGWTCPPTILRINLRPPLSPSSWPAVGELWSSQYFTIHVSSVTFKNQGVADFWMLDCLKKRALKLVDTDEVNQREALNKKIKSFSRTL